MQNALSKNAKKQEVVFAGSSPARPNQDNKERCMKKAEYTIEEIRDVCQDHTVYMEELVEKALESALAHIGNLQEDNARLRKELDKANGVIR